MHMIHREFLNKVRESPRLQQADGEGETCSRLECWGIHSILRSHDVMQTTKMMKWPFNQMSLVPGSFPLA